MQTLFSNLGATDTVAGKTVADYVADVDNGGATGRWDVAWAIAASQDAVQILGSQGSKYVIDGNFEVIGPEGGVFA